MNDSFLKDIRFHLYALMGNDLTDGSIKKNLEFIEKLDAILKDRSQTAVLIE